MLLQQNFNPRRLHFVLYMIILIEINKLKVALKSSNWTLSHFILSFRIDYIEWCIFSFKKSQFTYKNVQNNEDKLAHCDYDYIFRLFIWKMLGFPSIIRFQCRLISIINRYTKKMFKKKHLYCIDVNQFNQNIDQDFFN